MKKLLAGIFFFLLSGLLSVTLASESISDYKVYITIQKDGHINVEERILYDFEDMQRHGIFRTIPYIKTNAEGKKFKLEVDQFSVKNEDGKSYDFSKTTSDGDITLNIGSPTTYVTGKKNYIIRYRVGGAITYFSDHDELYWNAIGDSWTVPIVNTEVRVTKPEGAGDRRVRCFTGNGDQVEENCTVKQVGKNAIFGYQGNLNANTGMGIVIELEPGAVAYLEPEEYLTFWQTLTGKLTLVGIILLAFFWYFILPIWIIIKWFISGRDPDVGIPLHAYFDPPATKDGRVLNAIETGGLYDEKLQPKDFYAGIIGLAQKGYISIYETDKKWELKREKSSTKSTTISGTESIVYDSLFGTSDLVKLEEVKLATLCETVKKQVYETLTSEGFFEKNPDKIRSIYFGLIGLAAMSLNIPLVFSAAIFGLQMPRKTWFGAKEMLKLKGLKNFLASQERQINYQGDKQLLFERLLPYAIALGVEKQWVERFEDVSLVAPAWYHSNQPFTVSHFVSSMSRGSFSFRAVATPTRSSSGFSSGSSGGGFSGGGGGGGGGSW